MSSFHAFVDNAYSSPTLRQHLSIAWHATQAAVECLITCPSFQISRFPDNLQSIHPLRTVLLSRVLLKARSGMRQSDLTINYIVRNIIQTGCLATAWALAALATWFLLSNNISVYRIFDMTSGTVYTHVSVFFFSFLLLVHLNGSDIFRPCSRRFCPASGYVSG